ncbi:MAG TPA: glycerophosphodiester phosphodiesterase [Myxococcota bacterium]|nr:glycerophosphodiester phosphodiesterase [Myxococcota bacterium]
MSRPPRPLVIAHRGASGHRRENTLPAYALAVEMRADMIEIDLHRTRDAATVVIHDDRPEGLAAGPVGAASLEEVRHLDLGGGERVPTFDEVLDAFGAAIPFNVELKRGPEGAYPGLARVAAEAVAARGLVERTLFSSFEDAYLEELGRLEPRSRRALLLGPRTAERPLERARAVGAEALNPWRGLASPELVAAAHAAGLAVYVYTVNAEDEMRRLLDLGVDGLFTDYPDRLRRLVPRGECEDPKKA